MELREFIVETISGIVDATNDLQELYGKQDILINPPTAQSGSDVFQANSSNYTLRRVQNVSFDVAVVASSQSDKGGKAGISVFFAELGVEAGKSMKSENASRVSFAIPMTLKPTSHETANMVLAQQK